MALTDRALPAGVREVDEGILHGRIASLAEMADPRSTVVVTDAALCDLYGSALAGFPLALVPAGEAAKNLASLETLYDRFMELELDRGATVLAFGGGSVSDLAGFAAATWMRGVRFAVAPTTLLAMVDASMGGKNAVDFRGRKNLIGTFLQPDLVFCDAAVLASLPAAEFRSGMAEIIKHGIIDGEDHFAAIEEFTDLHASRIASGDLTGVAGGAGLAALESLIARSQRLKMRVVRSDERESGPRRLLNLGHTAGHGIESATGLPHGFAVAAGLGFACRLSRSEGSMDDSTLRRVERIVRAWGLPFDIAGAAETARFGGGAERLASEAASYLSADKKRSGASVRFALPLGIGWVEMRGIGLSRIQSFLLEDL